MTDSPERYSFTCPNCSESLAIPLDRIPPVQARFSCPKCGKPMDFPSREEARVYMMLQGRGEDPPDPLTAPPADPPAAPAEKSYRVDKKGFENDVYDRRAMRDLIRSGGIAESDPVVIGSEAARRAGDFPELKSLFELKKSSRADPPAVCRKHTDLVAHYLCTDTGRPLCEACAAEKKFGGASVRVCDHCGGTAAEIPMES